MGNTKSSVNVKKVKYGRTDRFKFGKIDEVLEIPYLDSNGSISFALNLYKIPILTRKFICSILRFNLLEL